MSWVTNKAILDAALEDLGYSEIPNNLKLRESPSSKIDKCYNYEIEINTELYTGSTVISSDVITLEMGYLINSNSDKATAVDDFRDVMEAIAATSPFNQFTSSGTFERFEDDNKKMIATVQFIYGLEGCSL